jgi:hypothetical protein
MDVRSIEGVPASPEHQGSVPVWWLFKPREMRDETPPSGRWRYILDVLRLRLVEGQVLDFVERAEVDLGEVDLAHRRLCCVW